MKYGLVTAAVTLITALGAVVFYRSQSEADTAARPYRAYMAQAAKDDASSQASATPSAPSAPSTPPAMPPVPGSWPTTLQLGVSDSPGGAAKVKAGGLAFRYQYLAGGVNTGTGWATWNESGKFATYYIEDSAAAGVVPVFTYYMIRQSNPGAHQDEAQGIAANLGNNTTMRAYYADLELFFRRAGAFKDTPAVLHVEPDLWGYMQQASKNDNATAVAVAVASSGHALTSGLPDNAAGFAQAVVRMRDQLAPNVQLGYHLSSWGTGDDPLYSDPAPAKLAEIARRSVVFYQSLGADFDVVFAEFSDRDSAFKHHIYGDKGASWWDAGDFARHLDILRAVSSGTGKRIVLWQVPFGNTKMTSMNNTWNHFQDNKVEWLLAGGHVKDYAAAGVIALLFGRGADGATCACDASGDGVTNPSPINGNTPPALNADDDGGYFDQQLAAYLANGAVPLP